ncbi:AsmA family protein [Thiovibrio frasassiensis]|uniref:AsmA-like C-terminal domain-containing protein n=1 Tax=Thiovibrio frasassiensis TaxID=2984131 RepID=A0A9X4RN12_9BACT|nr:AsmA-like C-terminal domain-containing protein [Thiovibrio frasassiensis]MDG4476768.1 AsmA-like C-terminal domain-containing protein [Thiovibrio frasassiensis]
MNLPKITNLRLRSRILLACAVFVLLGVITPALLLPHLIDLDALKAQMSNQVNAKLNGTLQTERLEWAWLPLPHLNLRNTRFTSEDSALVAPMVKVYPDWLSLFRGKARIGKIVLTNPEMRVSRFPATLSEPPDPELAGLKVVIRNGTLQVAANSQWPVLRSRDFTMKGLSGSVGIGLAAVEFKLSGKPAEGEDLAFSGEYLREDGSYRLKFSCRNFNLRKIFHSFAEGALIPEDSPLNLKGSLEGRGVEKIRGKIVGDAPCLLAFPKDKKIVMDCGFVDLSFAKDGDNLLVTLNEFEMRDPGLKLAGTVRRTAGSTPESAPVWQIDLKGEDFDLTKIRAAVLGMWGEHEVARRLGEIVQSGKAGKATYKFKGTTADFEYVRNMHLTAEGIEDATVVIPEGGLRLTDTKGKLRIEKGLLVVDAEQGEMGNSRGKNCHLILGLPDDDFTFKLDVDLDADLAELPAVLRRLVDHQPFQEELAKFSGVSGRASGHLHLGDHLRDFQVALEVASMQGKGRYAPLAWDFAVDGGEMTIAPPLVQWRNVRGDYGPHVVKKSAGQVRFPDDIFLEVTQLDAVLAAKELEKEDLSYFKEITGALQEHITRADGRIELRNTTISGKASEPKLWKADADVLVQNLAVTTPSCPEPIRIKQGKGHLSDKEITVSEASGSVFGDPFTLTAALSHKAFAALRGKISLQGKVGQGFGQWLKERQLVSPALFPHLPFRMESLQVDLQEEKTLVKGVIRPENVLFSPAKADFAVEFSVNDPLKMSAHVYGAKEEAVINVDFLDNTKEIFLFSWKGELSRKTVDQLLDRKNLLRGKIAGDFQLYLPRDPNKVACTGQIEVKDLRWYLEEQEERFVDIQELRLAGAGKDLKVRRLACALNAQESVELYGLVSRVGNGLAVKLDLTSPALSRKTLLELRDTFKRLKDNGATAASGEPRQESLRNITGTVVFDVEKFSSGPKAGESGSPTLVWQPLKGEIRIHPQWRMSALISNGRLCCLDTTGEWFSTPALGMSHFSLNSACPTPPRFEVVLPCLGYPQDLIEGEFSLNGRLEGVLDNWQDGHLQIESHQGRILRMKLLSKIFSVVNITDLFSVNPVGDGSQASTKGFPYTDLLLKAHVKDNELIIDEAVVRGEGLNLFARGKMNLATFELDIVVMISPFKTLDAIVSKVPLVGRVIGGETATLVTIPVGVTGKASDPEVTLLPPSAVGEGLLNIVKRTLLLPFHILSPILPDAATEPEKKP